MIEFNVSPSIMKKAKNCLFHFYCEKVNPQTKSDVDEKYGESGKSVHSTLEYHFKEKLYLNQNEEEVFEKLKIVFDEKWKAYESVQSMDKNLYWLCVIYGVKTKLIPTNVEHEYIMFIDSVPIHIYIDWEDTINHIILDWKTSTFKSRKVEEYKEQVKFYSVVYRELYKVIPKAGVMFNKIDKRIWWKFKEETIDAKRKEIIDFYWEMQKRAETNDFPRNPSRNGCFFCPYKDICATDLLREKKQQLFELKIHIKPGDKLQIEGIIPEQLHKEFEDIINYEVKNAAWLKLHYKRSYGKDYDGIKRLYKRKPFGAETYQGYLHKIHSICKDYCLQNGLKLRIVLKDYRDQDIMKEQKIGQLNIEGYTLYDHQIEGPEQMLKYRWACCEVGTGGGKTEMAAICINNCKASKTIFIIDNKALLNQTKKEYERLLPTHSISIVGMGQKDWSGDIVMCTIQTLYKHIKEAEFVRELKKFNCLIADECLIGKSKLQTEDGSLSIRYIVENKYAGKVLSYNHETKEQEWKPIINWFKTESRKDYKRVFFEGRKKPIMMTNNHKMFINGEYKRIDEAKVGDLVYMKKLIVSEKGKLSKIGINNPNWQNSERNDGHRIFARSNKFQYEHQKVFCEFWNIDKIIQPYLIHHLDEDPSNNDINNLLLMEDSEHKSYHHAYATMDKKEQILRIAKGLQLSRIAECSKFKYTNPVDLIPIKIERIDDSKFHPGSIFYDIEVQDNHNFFVEGFLSSNCHGWSAKSYETVSKRLENTRYRFGFSATCKRDDWNDNMIFAFTGTIVYRMKAKALTELGILTPVEAIFYTYPVQLYSGDNWQNEYQSAIVENEYRNKLIAQIANEWLAKGKQILILTKYIEHGKTLKELLPMAEFIYGQTEDEIREDQLQLFKDGKLNVLIGNIKIFNKGLNIKNLDVLINASGNAGEVVTTQSIGRALRKHEGKITAYYLDFIDHGEYCNEHSRMRKQALLDEHYDVKVLKIELVNNS